MNKAIENNRLLKNLYESKWHRLSNDLIRFNMSELDNKQKATHPLLIKTNGEYENADIKIMFFGQETNVWFDVFDNTMNAESLIEKYQKFYLNKRYYNSPLWNCIDSLLKKISQTNHKKIGLIWNNVVKVGKCKEGTPKNEVLSYTLKDFNVISEEIKILKPDVLLFFSGNYYLEDKVGRFLNPEQPIIDKLLWKLNFSYANVKLALRTYHPNYLSRKGKAQKDEVLKTIANMINTI